MVTIVTVTTVAIIIIIISKISTLNPLKLLLIKEKQTLVPHHLVSLVRSVRRNKNYNTTNYRRLSVSNDYCCSIDVNANTTPAISHHHQLTANRSGFPTSKIDFLAFILFLVVLALNESGHKSAK